MMYILRKIPVCESSPGSLFPLILTYMKRDPLNHDITRLLQYFRRIKINTPKR